MASAIVSRFTPRSMSYDVLEAIFVQRQELVKEIVENIRESSLTSTKHFQLLIGVRGIGKSFLIALVYHRLLRIEDLKEKLLIAWLSEEEWGISSFLDLLLKIFRSLADNYPQEYRKSLRDSVDSLYQLSTDEAEASAAHLLHNFIKDRCLLLLLENLDELFDGLGNSGQQKLRAYIQNYSSLTILATSQRLFKAIRNYSEPFHGFFQVTYLEPLTLEEARELLANLAHLQDDKELENFINTPTGQKRIKAIHYLAGGNHRIYVILAEFLTRQALDDLVIPFMQTLDELTPYYQTRMQCLSPQQRKIIECIVDFRHAVTVKEIAQRCFITPQTTSGQLRELRQKGYLISETIGRESFYELSEVLMRFCFEVKRQQGQPISLFIDFMRIWYSEDELQKRLIDLPQDALERNYILKALDLNRQEKEFLCNKLYKEIDELIASRNYNEALKVCKKAIDNDPGNSKIWYRLGRIYEETQNFEQAFKYGDIAIELSPDDSFLWYYTAGILEKLNCFEEALKYYQKAIDLESNISAYWYAKGLVLEELDRYEEALEAYQKAISIEPDNDFYFQLKGDILEKLERYEEALDAYNKALEIDCTNAYNWFARGITLEKMSRYEEALIDYKQAIDCDEQRAVIWFRQGIVLEKLNQIDEAIESLAKASLLETELSMPLYTLTRLLITHNYWQRGKDTLNDLLSRFAHQKDELDLLTELTERIVYAIWQNHQSWPTRIMQLLEIYQKYDVLAILGQGTVKNIPALLSSNISDETVQEWLTLWTTHAEHHPSMEIPLRLLTTAVNYQLTQGNRKVLMSLPIEERTLLESLLSK
jgi:tetratricopeptide (TPR) repeat protein